MTERPTFGSLFSGIGGIDRGLEMAGWECRWQSEIDSYACKVLRKHWPDVPNLGDVTAVDWSTVEHVDLVCGGYPCQPFSLAGKRAGADDERYLWPYFADALRLLRPRWALLENVPGHLGLGFDRTLADLASLGFDAEWELLPAAAFGAPHLRYRLYVVAHAVGNQLRQQPIAQFGSGGTAFAGRNGASQPLAHANGERQPQPGWTLGEKRGRPGNGGQELADADSPRRREQRRSEPVRTELDPTQRCGEDVADPDQSGWRGRTGIFGQGRWGQPEDCGGWESEPDVGRVANGIPARVDRLRCLGNAVVPQVAEWVGRHILTAMEAA